MATHTKVPQEDPLVRTSLRLPKSIDDELEYNRIRTGITKQAAIIYALREYLKLGAA